MMKKLFIPLFMFILVGALFFVSAESYSDGSVCCEVGIEGGVCVNGDSMDDCNPNNLSSYTSCEATSYCKLGTCYDSDEGICMARTSKAVCEEQGFVWDVRDESQIPQCQLGCCLISTEVAFTTLTRCRTISQDYGIPISFRSDVDSELACVSLALGQDEGACVYESDYQLMCERTTRDECDALGSVEYYDGEDVTLNPLEDVEKTFYKDVLCSSDKLGTICTAQASTGCYDGQVYWYDSCGNRENVVANASNKDGLRDSISANVGDASGYSFITEPEEDWYGACDVFEGTTCDDMDNPGKFVQQECRDTYCIDDEGDVRLNGESWCVADDDTLDIPGGQSVGSRSYRLMCIDGRILTEACDAYRNYVCYEGEILFDEPLTDLRDKDKFSSAACVVNRWEDCMTMDNEDDCSNFYERDCTWVTNHPVGVSLTIGEEGGICLPSYSPGTLFWEESGEDQCSLGSATCVVEYEASLWSDLWNIGNAERRNEIFEERALDNDAVSNISCVDGTWEQDMNLICASLGDCGGNVNYVSSTGSGGYQIRDYEFIRTGEEQSTNYSLRDTNYKTVMQKISGGLLGLNE